MPSPALPCFRPPLHLLVVLFLEQVSLDSLSLGPGSEGPRGPLLARPLAPALSPPDRQCLVTSQFIAMAGDVMSRGVFLLPPPQTAWIPGLPRDTSKESWQGGEGGREEFWTECSSGG